MKHSQNAPSRLASPTGASHNSAAATRPTDSPEKAMRNVFRFLDLPAELRIQIYKYLLPHDLVISFHEDTDRSKCRFWTVRVQQQSGNSIAYELGGSHWYCGGYDETGDHGHTDNPHGIAGDYHWEIYLLSPPTTTVVDLDYRTGWRNDKYIGPRDEAPLYYINKAMATETQAILYGSNIFKFKVDGVAHEPVSLRSPKIFGALGVEGRLHLLRNLRSIHIEMTFKSTCRWTVKRLRARLDYFVEVLKKYADNDSKRSLLTDLAVEVKLEPIDNLENPQQSVIDLESQDSHDHALFTLESLVALRGIKNVKVMGVPDWYAKCMQLCIQGRGGEPEDMDWPFMETRSRDKKGKWQKRWVTTRKWYHPTLDWKTFAERNGIETPAEIDKFWMAE